MTPAQTTTRPSFGRVRAFRDRVRSTPSGRVLWRTVVTVVGVVVIAGGVVLLPLPGPGWLIIFAGLGILATEYDRARRLLRFAREQLSRWTAWVARQNRVVQALTGLLGAAFLVALFLLMWWIYAG